MWLCGMRKENFTFYSMTYLIKLLEVNAPYSAEYILQVR